MADEVEAVAGRLAEAAKLIRDSDPEKLSEWQNEVRKTRWGLLEAELANGPLIELRIVVANRPGTMATLALALGDAGVNIEDMALYPAPDMTSGAVSLWVAGPDQAERGAALVRELGHGVTIVGSGG